MISNQIKSKQRVTDHGEVYTHQREVNAMLDLVKHETERIDSRFLEPACGTGNFLVEILSRKLVVVKTKYAKSQLEFERYVMIAVGSIYGIDILHDNITACQQRYSQDHSANDQQHVAVENVEIVKGFVCERVELRHEKNNEQDGNQG